MVIIITAIVMLFTVNQTAFPDHHPRVQSRAHSSTLIFCIPTSGLPIKNESRGGDSFFRASPSFHGQSYNNCLQFNREASFLFELFLKGSGTHSFLLAHFLKMDDALLLTLFSVIISPNAP
jgi:hypothetical protein